MGFSNKSSILWVTIAAVMLCACQDGGPKRARRVRGAKRHAVADQQRTLLPPMQPLPLPAPTFSAPPPRPASPDETAAAATPDLPPTPAAAAPAPTPPPVPSVARPPELRFSVTGVAPTDTLRVRAAPDPNAPVVGELAPNTTRVIGSRQTRQIGRSQWREVSYGWLEGWVNNRFLAPEATGDGDPAPARAAIPAPPPVPRAVPPASERSAPPATPPVPAPRMRAERSPRPAHSWRRPVASSPICGPGAASGRCGI